MKPATELIHFEAAPDDPFTPLSTPIYQTATFEQPSAIEFGRYDYSRSGNPTRAVLEAQLARLERAPRAFAYASGMAALQAVGSLVAPGATLLAGDDLYGGTHRLLTQVLQARGVTVRFADLANPERAAHALADRPSLVLVETPTNPLLRVVDLRRLAQMAHQAGARLAVDASLLSPYLMRPLELGADLVVHSATKALGGHSDLTAGVVAASDAALCEKLAFHQNAEGVALGPFDSWLLLRGIKTLGLRLDRQQANAQRLAEFLAAHPDVARVRFPGLRDHPGAALHRDQAHGPGAVLSFETGSFERSRRLVEALKLFRIAVSFGSVISTASLPCRMSHASIPEAVRVARELPEDLIRLSVGIEDADDLIADLAAALEGM
jgi:cysteine-S-conjugate beta-lyase